MHDTLNICIKTFFLLDRFQNAFLIYHAKKQYKALFHKQ